MVVHIGSPDNPSDSEHPGQQILNRILIIILGTGKGLVAEEVKGSGQDSPCIVEPLHADDKTLPADVLCFLLYVVPGQGG